MFQTDLLAEYRHAWAWCDLDLDGIRALARNSIEAQLRRAVRQGCLALPNWPEPAAVGDQFAERVCGITCSANRRIVWVSGWSEHHRVEAGAAEVDVGLQLLGHLLGCADEVAGVPRLERFAVEAPGASVEDLLLGLADEGLRRPRLLDLVVVRGRRHGSARAARRTCAGTRVACRRSSRRPRGGRRHGG